MTFGATGLIGAGAAEAAVPRCDGRKVKTLSFSTGQVRIYKSHRFACAVTVAKNPGRKRQISVSIQARGSLPRWDNGRYTHHAGPVGVAPGNRCVFVRGAVGDRTVSSGWILC
ncbi:hypothetical protein [Streptomyces sp. 8N706]|uniref:hypothetical protein n=1 Tax=Streptomyces sp. 8N706 TaxID=3457416 RepID=UPI003FD077CA